MSLISVVVPVYHNAETLTPLLERLSAVAGELGADEFEFVFVDDGSFDTSFSVLEEAAARDSRVRVIRLSRNFGSNAAILAGLTHAGGDAVVVIAADLQDPPEVIPELATAWRDGAEVVLAARRGREDPLLTRMFASLFNRLFRRLVFRDFPRSGFDFLLLSGRVADVIVRMGERNSYIFGQAMWVGYRRSVIEYDRASRPSGESKWTFAKKVKYFIDAFTAFSYLPIRAVSVVGVVFALLGFIYAAVVIILRLTGAITGAPGFASLAVLVLVAAGIQLLVTGMIGEYLWRVLEESRGRPAFLVESTVNLAPPQRHEGRP